MKKSKLIIAIMAIMMCLVLALAGCNKKNEDGNGEDPNAVLQKSNYKEEAQVLYKTISDLNYDGYSVSNVVGTLAKFEKNDYDNNEKYTAVYNVKTGSEIASYTDKTTTEAGGKQVKKVNTVTLRNKTIEDENISYFVVKESTGIKEEDEYSFTYTYKVSVINASGTTIASKDFDKDEATEANNATNLVTSNDLVVILDSLYRINKDGSFSKISDNYGNGLTAKSIPANIEKVGDYYYSENGNYTVTVYDLDLNAKSYYKTPSYAQNIEHGILSNGNIFVQYVIPMTADDDYDIIMDNNYYALKQMIVSAEDGSVSDVAIGYYIEWIGSEDLEGTGYNTAYVNMASGYAIEDGYVNTNEYVRFVVDDGCGIVAVLKNVFIANEEYFDVIAQDRVIVRDKNGKYYLYSFDKSLIGAVNVNAIIGSIGNKYFFDSENIYDMDLKVVCAYKENKYVYNSDTELFSKEIEAEDDDDYDYTEYYVFANGNMKLIAGKKQSVETLTPGIYKVTTSTNDSYPYTYTYALYNKDGDRIGGDFNKNIYYQNSVKGAIIVRTTNSSDNVIYKVIK